MDSTDAANTDGPIYEIDCTNCGAPNPINFDAPNVETNEARNDVFYLTCKWGKCNYRGEYLFSDMKRII
ncbi:MAG TPA: hypothetical protein VGO56_07440 [Pyrinomonadaceae bacterium]|nr:hypothetical protein [Pyrinomonadaceae bacterium]